MLLGKIEKRFPNAPDLVLAHQIIDITHRLTSRRYNVDLALITLIRVLKLPDYCAMTLFALGRIVGWIGHAIEQYEVDQLIRPRAKYVGPQPEISGV